MNFMRDYTDVIWDIFLFFASTMILIMSIIGLIIVVALLYDLIRCAVKEDSSVQKWISKMDNKDE